MSRHWQHLARETGIALAVLAIYVLTLLTPLHQAAGLQRDLNALGFSTLEGWSVCQPLVEDESGAPRDAAINCPATGVGKYELAAVLPPVLVLPAAVEASLPAALPSARVPAPGLPAHTGQSRAPPVPV